MWSEISSAFALAVLLGNLILINMNLCRSGRAGSFVSLLCTFLFFCCPVSWAAVTTTPLNLVPNTSLRNELQHAITKGAGWLLQSQNTNGWWSTPDHPAITSLALIALSSQKDRLSDPRTKKAIQLGYKFLKSCEQPNGGIYQKELPSYNTAISLMALVAGQRAEDQSTIVNARKFLIGLQAQYNVTGGTNNTFSGGMGYGNGDKTPDLSNTLVVLEALRFSKRALADKNIPAGGDLDWAAAVAFVQKCQNLPSHNTEPWVSGDPQNSGGFIYTPGISKAGETNLANGRVALRSYGSMTYAGLISYIYADLKPSDPRVTAAFNWLKDNYTLTENPGMGAQGLYYYYHLMTKALTLHGADFFKTRDGRTIHWREETSLHLINLQHPDGSWANENGRWFEKDAVLVTSYSLMALEMIMPKL